MDILLVSSTLSGIKKIDREVNLSFVKKNFDENAMNGTYVKCIYGTNGSGKSAIVHAYDILKSIVLNDFPFKDPIFKEKFEKLINKRTNVFSITNIFAVYFKDGIKRYRHKMSVTLDQYRSLCISSESLDLLNKRLDLSRNLIEVKDGVVVHSHGDFEVQEPPSVLKENSIIKVILNYREKLKDNELYLASLSTAVFCVKLHVSFGSNLDSHDTFNYAFLNEITRATEKDKNMRINPKTINPVISRLSGNNQVWLISRDEEDKYRKISKKLESFLKLLKPELVSLEISFKHPNETLSESYLSFHYSDYEIDYEYESTGIKKLCQLFIALLNASTGSIVVVDEVDAGIHDIFMTKLIEYFALYSSCQIILTTHNIALMDSLTNVDKSIDILSDECEIVSWRKQGRTSPITTYINGFLGGVPFNLQAIDFSSIFSEQ